MTRFSAYFAGGMVLTGFLYLISGAATMALAPRLPEGGRSVVAMSWLVFASLPLAITGSIGLGTALFLPGEPKHRIAFMIGVAVALFLMAGCCTNLLRRDYIGKF